MNDKRLFEWSNPNDPAAAVLVEYPVELGQGGRLIGEIHIDHVPVNYQKNSFEFSDRGWLAAVSYLRGPGPLLPQKARQLGYPENDSIIGKLFKGYRRNDAGPRYLVPGDGKGPLHDKTREWARKFYDGIPEYETDEIWWKAVLNHEKIKEDATDNDAVQASSGHPDEAAILTALGVPASSRNGGTTAPLAAQTVKNPVTPETEQQRLSRYESDSTILPDLSGDFGHPDLGFIKLTTRLASGPIIDHAEKPTPVWIAMGAGASATGFLDDSHELFVRFGWNYADALLMELAAVLKARADSPLSLSQITQLVESACLPDRALEVDRVSSQARELLIDIRQRMADRVADEPVRAYQWLGVDEVVQTENNMIADGNRGAGSLDEDGRFVVYAPPLYLVRLVEEWPEAFLDGKVFVAPYETLNSLAAKRLSLSRVTSLLSDVASLTHLTKPGLVRLQRARLSILLLSDEIAADG